MNLPACSSQIFQSTSLYLGYFHIPADLNWVIGSTKYKKTGVMQAFMVPIGYHENWKNYYSMYTYIPTWGSFFSSSSSFFGYKGKHLDSQYAWG